MTPLQVNDCVFSAHHGVFLSEVLDPLLVMPGPGCVPFPHEFIRPPIPVRAAVLLFVRMHDDFVKNILKCGYTEKQASETEQLSRNQ